MRMTENPTSRHIRVILKNMKQKQKSFKEENRKFQRERVYHTISSKHITE